jgi:hypothetical protein
VPYALAVPDDLKETVALVEELDRRVLSRQVDTRVSAQLDGVVADAVSEFGRIESSRSTTASGPAGRCGTSPRTPGRTWSTST